MPSIALNSYLTDVALPCHQDISFSPEGFLLWFLGFFFVLFCFVFVFLELNRRHMEVPRLGVKSDLQLPTATATLDLSQFLNLHHSSRQCQILNPLREGQGSNPHPHGY